MSNSIIFKSLLSLVQLGFAVLSLLPVCRYRISSVALQLLKSAIDFCVVSRSGVCYLIFADERFFLSVCEKCRRWKTRRIKSTKSMWSIEKKNPDPRYGNMLSPWKLMRSKIQRNKHIDTWWVYITNDFIVGSEIEFNIVHYNTLSDAYRTLGSVSSFNLWHS